MKVVYHANANVSLESECSDVKEALQFLSGVSEVFSINKCGACKSEEVRPLVRHAAKGKQTFDFYELSCSSCKARLSFGQLADGSGLFPKRKDDEGNYLPNGGWTKFTPTKEE